MYVILTIGLYFSLWTEYSIGSRKNRKFNTLEVIGLCICFLAVSYFVESTAQNIEDAMCEIILLSYLCFIAYIDYKDKQIPLVYFFILIPMLLIKICVAKNYPINFSEGMFMICLLGMGMTLKKVMGFGDILSFFVVTLMQGIQMALVVFLVALFIVSIYGLVLSFLKRLKIKSSWRIAFVPFVCISFCAILLLNIS